MSGAADVSAASRTRPSATTAAPRVVPATSASATGSRVGSVPVHGGQTIKIRPGGSGVTTTQSKEPPSNTNVRSISNQSVGGSTSAAGLVGDGSGGAGQFVVRQSNPQTASSTGIEGAGARTSDLSGAADTRRIGAGIASSSKPSSSKVTPSSSSSTFLTGLKADDDQPRTTPHGINLHLDKSTPVPQLLSMPNRGDSARQCCRDGERKELLALIEKGADINEPDKYGNTCLMIAASRGETDIVEDLLNHGANIHAKDKYGQTALIQACAKGNYEVAKILVEKKAGVNVTTTHGQTALMKVCYISHLHQGVLLELLLNHKARPDIQMDDGTGAVHIAAQQDHMEALEILVRYGANINLQKQDGTTPLHIAAEKGSFTMISKLIGTGADPNIKNNEGQTILDVKPLPTPSGEMPSLDSFRQSIQSAIDAGMQQREEQARLQAEQEGIKRRLQLERKEAEQRTEHTLNLEQCSNYYVDEQGVEHYSRPSSARLSEEEMKARTYKPKIDPRAVFGADDEQQEKSNAEAKTG